MNIDPHGLKRDRAANGRVLGLVDDAHGAAAKLTGNLVSANRLKRHQGFFFSDSVAPLLWGKLTVSNREDTTPSSHPRLTQHIRGVNVPFHLTCDFGKHPKQFTERLDRSLQSVP